MSKKNVFTAVPDVYDVIRRDNKLSIKQGQSAMNGTILSVALIVRAIPTCFNRGTDIVNSVS